MSIVSLQEHLLTPDHTDVDISSPLRNSLDKRLNKLKNVFQIHDFTFNILERTLSGLLPSEILSLEGERIVQEGIIEKAKHILVILRFFEGIKGSSLKPDTTRAIIFLETLHLDLPDTLSESKDLRRHDLQIALFKWMQDGIFNNQQNELENFEILKFIDKNNLGDLFKRITIENSKFFDLFNNNEIWDEKG